MDPSPWLLLLLFASQDCAWAEKIRWKERIWSNWLWCTSWIRWEDNWTWYKGRNSAVFWCIFWLKLHAYDWFIHRWLNWSLGMKQIGVGVAVVVFGLVFALGDFLPSGRYDLHKRFTPDKDRYCILLLKSEKSQQKINLSVPHGYMNGRHWWAACSESIPSVAKLLCATNIKGKIPKEIYI